MAYICEQKSLGISQTEEHHRSIYETVDYDSDGSTLSLGTIAYPGSRKIIKCRFLGTRVWELPVCELLVKAKGMDAVNKNNKERVPWPESRVTC